MSQRRRRWRTAALLLLSVCTPISAWAGGIQGKVTQAGSGLSGAMVTARALDREIETTVFTGPAGDYRIDGLSPGDYALRAKAPGRREALGEVLIQPTAFESLSFELTADPDFRKWLPSSTWLDLLPDGEMKREFVLNCTSCHEISHGRVVLEGEVRSREHWLSAIALMRAIDAYGLTPPDFDDAKYAGWLATHFAEPSLERLQVGPAASGAALTARITEYPVPKTPSLPHDLVIGPKGRIWITAFYNNVVWALDPSSGETESFNVNDNPEVMGQVRALTFGPQGMLWVLLGGTESLVRLNPEDGQIRTFPVGMYPHSIEVDSKGQLWFNDYISSSKRIGRMEPGGDIETFTIPGAVLAPSEGLPLLYGLQIDRGDVVWGTMLAANRLFRFDPIAERAELFEMPFANSGPRRPGVAPDGSIWIPEFNTGNVTRFDPQAQTFERYALGSTGLGLYDVAVDQRNGHVWSAASLGSALIRLDPGTGRKDVYPFPTEPAYPRHLAIDPESGDVWTTYSSMPDAVPKIVRVELSASAEGK